ncbi:MAG TPA: DUF4129 domain-containing protein [Anaerolineales bacterium]|nr:DUF4129 domain-containing protein [Anaerolineales bacterium]
MRGFFNRKNWIVFLSVIALGALVVLASGLRDVTFRAGQALGQNEAGAVDLSVARFVDEIVATPLWKQLLAWGVVFLIVVLLSLLLSPESRRKLIQTFFRFMMILLAIYLAFKYVPGLGNLFNLGGQQLQQQGTDSNSNAPIPIFVPPHVSSWLVFLVSVAVAVILVALVWTISHWWRRRQAFFASQRPLEEFGEIARHSLDELSTGRAWDDVIVDCYARMSKVVEKRRGLTRHYAMTPSEFAARLEISGLPGDAVHKLTRLFERVRYGARASTQDEINEAVNCLTAIMSYCGEVS